MMGVGWALGTYLGPKNAAERRNFIHYWVYSALRKDRAETLKLSEESRLHFATFPAECEAWNKEERRTVRNRFKVIREDGRLRLLGRRTSAGSSLSPSIWQPCLLEEDFEAVVLQTHREFEHCSGQRVYRQLLKIYCRLPYRAIQQFEFRSKCCECAASAEGGETIALGDGDSNGGEEAVRRSPGGGRKRRHQENFGIESQTKRERTLGAGGGAADGEEGWRFEGVAISSIYDKETDVPGDERHLGRVHLPPDVDVVIHEVEAINSEDGNMDGSAAEGGKKRRRNACMEDEMKNASIVDCRNDVITLLVTTDKKVVAMVIPPCVHRAFHNDARQSAISASAVEKRAAFRRFLTDTMEETSSLIRTKKDRALRGCSVCPRACNPRREGGELLKEDLKRSVAFLVGHRRPQIVRPNSDDKRCRSERDRSYLQTYWPLERWDGLDEQVSIATKFYRISSAVADKMGRMMETYLPECHRRVTRQMKGGVECTLNGGKIYTAISYNRRLETCWHCDKGDAFCGTILTLCESASDFKLHCLRDFKIVGSDCRGIGLKIYDGMVQFSQARYYIHGNLRPTSDCISIVAFAHYWLSRDGDVKHMEFRRGQEVPMNSGLYDWPTVV